MPNKSNTTTLAFTPWASYSPVILSITLPPYTLEDLDDSDLSTAKFKKTVPADLQEIGDMTIVARFPSDSAKRFTNEVGDLLVSGTNFDATPGTATITFPVGTSGDGTAPTLAGSAYVKGFEPAELNNDDRMTVTITLRFDGQTVPTYAVGAV